MCADFNFFLNRQGVRGVQGVKGDDGFSPIITVAQDNADGYKLHIQTATDDFDTSNLRPPITNAGGKYLLWDSSTGTMTAGFLDYASADVVGGVNLATAADMTEGENTQVVPSVKVVADYIASELEGNNTTISNTITQAIYENIDAKTGSAISVTKILGTDTEITGIEIGVNTDNDTIKINEQGQLYADIQVEEVPVATTSVAGIVKPDGSTITVDADGTIHGSNYTLPAATRTKLGGVIIPYSSVGLFVDSDGNLSMQPATNSTLGGVKPDGTTITITDDGTISAVGGGSGSGDVTAAGDNTFSGSNTFGGNTTFTAPSIFNSTTIFNSTSNFDQNVYVTALLSLKASTYTSERIRFYANNLSSPRYVDARTDGTMFKVTTSGNDVGIRLAVNNSSSLTLDSTVSITSGDNSVTIANSEGNFLALGEDTLYYHKKDNTNIDLLNPTVDLSEINSQISAMQADIAAIEQQIGNIVTKLNEINGEDI